MNRRGLFAAIALVTASVACTLTQSLDYLKQGGASDDGGGGRDVGEASIDSSIFAPPVPLAQNQSRPSSLTQDVDNLYWLNAAGEVWTVPKSGGQARSLGTVGTGAPATLRLAADVGTGGFVYAIFGGAVRRIAKTGGTAETIFTATPDPVAIAADNQLVFLAQAGTIVRLASDGGARATLANGQAALGLALSGSNVLWLNSGVSVQVRGLPKDAVPDAAVQIYDPTNQTDLSGSEFAAFAADTEAAYYAEKTFIYRLLTVPNPGKMLEIYSSQSDDFDTIDSVAVDGQFVYVAENVAQGLVVRAPKTGGPAEIVAAVRQPTSVIVDNRAIYFLLVGAGANDGAVMSVTKP